MYLFIDCAGSSLLRGLSSSCGEQGLLFRCGAWDSHCRGLSYSGAQTPGQASFSSCSTWAQWLWLLGSRTQTQQLWCTGLVALQHVGSSWTRGWTHVSCIDRRILYHWAIREALSILYIVEYMCQPPSPILSLPLLSPLVAISLFSRTISVL